ncbi:hypothetical protein MPH_11985 [Macrophomina phaseolina MS6]|uniref:Uncharacterized protein n=1 Tax=Macrophomina phaseolina (strain MS6) TaxID=1126212 RepID=K2RDH5_MACPH|nr:hypothetical protein MPH_11985 [Macrophomina phaseolina MS6]
MMPSSSSPRLRPRGHWRSYVFKSATAIHLCLTLFHQVNEIAAVPRIDVLFIGLVDLANDIGHPITARVIHEELKAAFDRIHKTAVDYGEMGRHIL